MSRSYRKPYCAISGVNSAHRDKIIASRAVRRTQNRALREFWGDWDEFLLPHIYECPHNDVWGWTRDGNNRLCFPPDPNEHWQYTFMTTEEHYEHDLASYARLCRK